MHIVITLSEIQIFFHVSNIGTGLITRKVETKMVEMLGKFAKVHNQDFCINIIVQILRPNLGKKKSVPKLLRWSELQQCCSAFGLSPHVGNISFSFLSDGNHFIWCSLHHKNVELYYSHGSLHTVLALPTYLSVWSHCNLHCSAEKNPLYVRIEKTEKAVENKVQP